jgi:hypothetical protein
MLKSHTEYWTYMLNNNRYHGNYNNREEGKIFNTLERYHIYEISRDNLHTNDIHIDTTPYSKHYTKFTQDNSTSPVPPPPPPHHPRKIKKKELAHYTSIMYTHKVR